MDIGDRRIGVAVSDPFNEYSLPVNTYKRRNLNADLEYFRALAKEKAATAFVCGVPVNFDGTPSVQTEKAKVFIEKLKIATGLPVYTEDERCTTCEAEEILIEQGKTRKERKEVIDSLAAANILQAFLNGKKFQGDKKMDNEKKNKHLHDEDCDCGCCHDHDHDHEDCDCGCDCDCDCDEDIVELTADDGRKLKFYLVGTIEYKGKNYSAFEPAEEIDGINEDDLIIFQLSGDDEETAELLPIEDEGLLNEVFEEFCRVLEEDELADEAASLEPDEK